MISYESPNILTNITFGFLLAEFGMTQTWIKQELDSLVWTYNGLLYYLEINVISTSD